jgi:hypothetical protein
MSQWKCKRVNRILCGVVRGNWLRKIQSEFRKMEGSTRAISVLIRRRQLGRLSNKKGYDGEGQVCDKQKNGQVRQASNLQCKP